jgi:hypothetical protein
MKSLKVSGSVLKKSYCSEKYMDENEFKKKVEDIKELIKFFKEYPLTDELGPRNQVNMRKLTEI